MLLYVVIHVSVRTSAEYISLELLMFVLLHHITRYRYKKYRSIKFFFAKIIKRDDSQITFCFMETKLN